MEYSIKKLNECKDELAYFMRRLYIQKLTTTSGGNLSLRLGDKILITPSSLDKARMGGEQIGVMDISGNIVGEKFKPSIESEMHLSIYRARKNVNAVVHAHPVAASAFAASAAPINAHYLAESAALLGEIQRSDYHCMGSGNLADSVCSSLGTHRCVLMQNHGALTVGKTLLEAFDLLEVLENTAQINLIMLGALKDHAVSLDADQVGELAEHMKSRS